VTTPPTGVDGRDLRTTVDEDRPRWNHNLHYHRVVLDAVPAHAAHALDVGCGEGDLARDLSARVPHVTAIDRHAPSIEQARHRPGASGIDFITGDFLEYELPARSYDLVASVAVVHHMDMERALSRMQELLRPGGTLVVIGLARSRRPGDLAFDAAGTIADRLHRLTKPYTEHASPTVWPPPLTYGQVRRAAERILPGVRYRRRALWRYSLVWTSPD